MKNFRPFPKFTLRHTFLIAFLIISVLPFTTIISSNQTLEKITISINGHGLIVEKADTSTKRKVGLMNREKLDWDKGMLFIYPSSRYCSFWMKNTKIPLSLAYIDKDYKITEILDLEPFDLKGKVSKKRVCLVLEVNKDWFEKNNIKVGDVVKGIT
jgi:uncharacterized membrane protein (UPF0127 family)